MGHTKGEWRAVCLGSEGWAVSSNLPIKQQGFVGYVAISRSAPFEECKANAQLISAAPDLFEELVDILDIINELRKNGLSQGSEYIRRIEKAQQAIKKVKGK